MSGAGETDPVGGLDDFDDAGDAAAVASDPHPVGGHVLPRQGLDLPVQGALIGLDGEHIVPARGRDRGGGLGVHCVCGDDCTDEVETPQQFSDRRDLVAPGPHRQLSQDSAGGVIEGGDQVRGALLDGAGTADSLAIDRVSPAGRPPRLCGSTGTSRAPDPAPRRPPPANTARMVNSTGRAVWLAPQLREDRRRRGRDPLPDRGERSGARDHRR